MVAVALVLGVVAAAAIWRMRGAETLSESDFLLLTDFVNTTGDPVFDGTLKQALAVKLEESPFLNIFPDERVRETLRLMERSPDERITRTLGREICQRQGVRALMTGEIAPLGSHYVVTLNALSCAGGDSLARQQVEAESKEEVLEALGRAASKMRRKLGESLASLERFDAPIEQATTSSLEALQAFSLANEQRAKAGDQAATPFFERAIELDPNFAMASARLGVIYSNSGESELAVEQIRKAYELRDRVSEAERLYLTAQYHNIVRGDADKTIETYELWKQTYPRDWTPYNNLAVGYSFTGQLEQAAEAAREALRLNPDHVFPYAGLALSYIWLNRLEEAKATLRQALARGFETPAVHQGFYAIAFLEGDREEMARQVAAVADQPGGHQMLNLEAGAAASAGRLQEARERAQRAVELAERYGFTESAAALTAFDSAREADFGNLDRAREQSRNALALSRGQQAMTVAAAVLARCGATQEAEALITELAERFPTDTLMQAVSLPMARASLALERGDPAEAIEHLEAVAPYERAYLGALYLRGQAYLELEFGAAAVAEFQKILDLKGVFPTLQIHVLARLGLARGHALASNLAASRRAYQDFLALWKDADEDIPLYREAQAEYEELRGSA